MSASLLREAAKAIREDAPALADDTVWHPAVALAVADWLDDVAGRLELGLPAQGVDHALAVARTYLNEATNV